MPQEQQTFEKINVNRGVTIRKDRDTGIQVFMYKDNPGHFYTMYGRPVSEEMAASVGFPVDDLRKVRQIRERKVFAAGEIDKEFAMGQKKDQVIETHGDYSLIDLGAGRVNVVDSAGNVYNQFPVPLGVGQKLLYAFSGYDGQPKDPGTVLIERERANEAKREALGLPRNKEERDAAIALDKPEDGADAGTVRHGEEQPSKEAVAQVKAEKDAPAKFDPKFAVSANTKARPQVK